jgi:hydroxyacyl-ACP dehydratase HTD2-like protein with hotdog domain
VPDIRVPIIPTKTLLARFSALSFNAHGIHLDPQYCREKEGYKNLLVHGPLSLILMLSVLRSQVGENIVYKLDYRNLAPLYVDEVMNVCVQRNQEYLDSRNPNQKKYDVWIEGSGGGFAVKGTAVVGPLGERDEFVYDG